MKRKPEQTSDKLKQQQYQNELLKKFVVGTLAPIARDGMVRTLKTGGDKNKGKMGAYISGVIYMNSKDAGIPDQSAYQAAMTAADNLVPAVKAVQAEVKNMKTRNPFIKFDELLHNVSDFITSSAIHGPGSEQMNQEQKDYIKKKSKGDIIVKTLEPFVQKQQLKGGAEPINDENEINLSWLTDDDDFIGKLKGGISFFESPWNWVKEKFGYETDQQKAERERLEEEQARQLDREEYSRRDHAYDSHGIDRSERDYNLHRLMQKRAMEANQPGVLKKTWNAIKESVKAHPVRWAVGTALTVGGLVALPYVIPKVAAYLAPAAMGVGAQKLAGNNGLKTEKDINLTPDEAEGVKRTVMGNFDSEKMGTSSYPSSFAERLYKPKVEKSYNPNLEERVKKAQEELANQKFMNVARQSSFGDILSQYGKNLSPEDRKHVLNIVNSESQMWGTRNPQELFQYKRDITTNLRNIQQALQKQGIDISEQLSDAKADFNTIFNTHLTAPLPKTWGDTAKEWSGLWMPVATRVGTKVMTSMGMNESEAQQLSNQIGDFTQGKINQGIQMKQQQRAMQIQNLQQREFLKEKQQMQSESMKKQREQQLQQYDEMDKAVKEENQHKIKHELDMMAKWKQKLSETNDKNSAAMQDLLTKYAQIEGDYSKIFDELYAKYKKENNLSGIRTWWNGDKIAELAKMEIDKRKTQAEQEIRKKHPEFNVELTEMRRKFELENPYIRKTDLKRLQQVQDQEKQILQTQIKQQEDMLNTLQQQEAKQIAIPLSTPVHLPSTTPAVTVQPISVPDLKIAQQIQQNQKDMSQTVTTTDSSPIHVTAGPNRQVPKPISVTPITSSQTLINPEQQIKDLRKRSEAVRRIPIFAKTAQATPEEKRRKIGKAAQTLGEAALLAGVTYATMGTGTAAALAAMKPVASAVGSKALQKGLSAVEKYDKQQRRKQEKLNRKNERLNKKNKNNN